MLAWEGRDARGAGPVNKRDSRQEERRLSDLRSHEALLWQVGISPIAGVDEAGMGPLAGPVVAAAVILPPEHWIHGLDDSKVLSRTARTRIAGEIESVAIARGFGIVGPGEIDEINIYQAGLRAMKLAVDDLEVCPRHVFSDAREIPGLEIPQTAFVKGDSRIYSIAAASVLAKVHRDALMSDLELQYPGYGFDRHCGYPTREHRSALRRLGPCPAHRRSFTLL
jgi:ribonuclease HII